MDKRVSNLLLAGFFIGFFFIGYIAFNDSMPEDKNKRVYELIKPHLPYTVDPSMSGFSIKYKITGEKESPPASEVLKRVDELDKQWGIDHLRLTGQKLEILDKNKKVIAIIVLQSAEEMAWVKKFYNK